MLLGITGLIRNSYPLPFQTIRNITKKLFNEHKDYLKSTFHKDLLKDATYKERTTYLMFNFMQLGKIHPSTV